MAETFDVPEQDSAFCYKYVVDPNAEEIDYPPVRKKFMDAIGSIPGKARHNGFQLAVLGRMPMKWANYPKASTCELGTTTILFLE